MTKIIKRLLPAALALALAGCAALPQDAPTSRYKVALIAKSTGQEFWNAVFTGAQAAATEYNIELTVTAPDNEEDFEGQNALIEEAVADGAKAIIFSAIDYEANAAAIDAAAQAGVVIINIDSQVNSGHVAAYIGIDNYGAGRMAAQSALDGVPGQLNVGLINYEVNGANGRDRAAGAKDAFEQSGRAKVVATAQTHPNADDARRDALEMLRDHPEINVLIALNEPSGVGAARAVHQAAVHAADRGRGRARLLGNIAVCHLAAQEASHLQPLPQILHFPNRAQIAQQAARFVLRFERQKHLGQQLELLLVDHGLHILCPPIP